MRFIKTLLKLTLALASFIPVIGQQPQSQDIPPLTPPFLVDASTANGTAPGYAPKATATGLVLSLGGGTANCSYTIVTYTAGTLTMVNNATNYVYLTTSGGCAPMSNTSGFSASTIPIAVVTTSGGRIISIVDVRTPFISLPPGTGCSPNIVASGCTGAYTALGATGNLGIPGPIFNAYFYGAVGDSTSNGATGTDNCLTLQAAIDAARTAGGSVYLPATQAGESVYYTSCTLNNKGVSIFSNPGAGLTGYWPSVAVRGAPGKDVFAPGDPNSAGYITPLSAFDWHDFGIIIDDSVDVSATLGAHRKPGKTCPDVLATNSSAVVTSGICEFAQGDVGQNVTLSDGTNTLSTTIIAVTHPGNVDNVTTTATLAAPWTYTTHANSNLYVSVMNMPTSARVGNCALAYDGTTSSLGGGINPANFTNMSIVTTSGGWQNNSCAFFAQGSAGQPYDTIWDHIFNRTYWGYVFVPADGLSSTDPNAALGDYNVFKNLQDQSMVPWLSYDGAFTVISNLQQSTAKWGLQILTLNEIQETTNSNWTIDNIEYEVNDVTPPGTGWRAAGADFIVRNAVIGAPSPYGSPAQWDLNASKCENCTAYGAVNITGFLNDMDFSDAADILTVNDTGFKNKCKLERQFNPFDSTQPAVSTSCSAVNSRQTNAFAQTGEFIANGDETTPYKNQADLFVWPVDMGSYGGNPQPVITADSTSETGIAGTILSSNGIAIAYLNTKPIVIGQTAAGQPNIPATLNHICFRAKADSGSGTEVFSFQVPLQSTTRGSVSAALTTTYGTYCFDADLTGLDGDGANFNIAAGGPDVKVAWISVHPWHQNVNTYAVTVGGSSSPMTSTHGTNGEVQSSDGTGTNGNLSQFDASGGLTNGPTAPTSAIVGINDSQVIINKTVDGVTPTVFNYLDPTSSVQTQLNNKVTATSPIVGQASCIKASGPPVVVGYCSTVVDSSGACTCN